MRSIVAAAALAFFVLLVPRSRATGAVTRNVHGHLVTSGTHAAAVVLSGPHAARSVAEAVTQRGAITSSSPEEPRPPAPDAGPAELTGTRLR
jgi:hypothetical protein